VGHGAGDEFTLTMPSSKWGLFQTSTDWCSNLTVLASDVIGKSVPTDRLAMRFPLHWSALDWGNGRHYVNFTSSDGDNMQWVMGNFTDGDEAPSYYANPKRGTIPFTWGLPVESLCQLSPRTLAGILEKATPNDDFIQFNGAGYYYPDFYGKARNTTNALELQAERLRAYMDLTGIRILAFNFQDWDSADAQAACEIFASKLPGLLGILAFQYYPYSAGNGAIRWVRGIDGDEVPVVSCRFTIWANQGRPRDNTPAAIAVQLNELPTAGERATNDSFSWVIAHAWSRFRKVEKNAPLNSEENGVAQDKAEPGTVRGYEPVLWVVDRLEQHVRPVKAQELLLRVRLRLRPQITLSRYLAEVEAGAKTQSHEFQVKLNEARGLIPKTGQDAAAARRCFELLKGLYCSVSTL
jgi:GxGYxYP putative glycoside hydrolase C-terminal domain